jgi:hypothetical protein
MASGCIEYICAASLRHFYNQTGFIKDAGENAWGDCNFVTSATRISLSRGYNRADAKQF